MATMQRVSLSPKKLLLTEVLTGGRYDARKLAALLDWNLDDVAHYLGRDLSTVSRHSTSIKYQDALAAMAVVVKEILDLLGSDIDMVRAWFRTPIHALEASPKELIVEGQFARVEALVSEYESSLAF
ncbi:MAG: hypothetical protein AB1714_05950 [Acidobacteriota bacterium]